jgi:sugar transferase (PEP-CTERM system associated)
MVRIFNVYYPTRTIVLLICEALIVSGSFLLAAVLLMGPPDAYLALNYEGGALKILAITGITLLCSYYFDLYAPQRTPARYEIHFRLMIVIGFLSLLLAVVCYAFPAFNLGHNVLSVGLIILTFSVLLWRSASDWVMGRELFRERVYVLGSGERARYIVSSLNARPDLGMKIVGGLYQHAVEVATREEFATELAALRDSDAKLDRVILAMQDRRGRMPVRELLELRLAGVKVEDATALLERISGKIQIDGLYPSALIFSEGFRISSWVLFGRRVISILVSLVGLTLALPLIPCLALAVRMSSPGPIFFRQTRVGLRGETFTVFKFRTMRADAEAGTGAVWARKGDPRITPIGRFMRKTRLDEIPQLWNVLRGDMGFVGPRPERPEFVQWLSEQIPYYNLRHIIRPGLTGWAQVRYSYGATLEETKEKLEYDLYYIKHMSVSLDLFVIFETIKTIVLRRGQ